MSTKQTGNLEGIFAEAIELPEDRRSTFIQQRCGGDSKLRAEVDSLLGSHQKNEQGGFVLNRELGATLAPVASVATIAEATGDTIGRYRLLEKIGEGGMGVVYMAEQLEGVYRRVALKIIKLGMDTRQVIARFEAERQALAMLDHPNITQVFDVGSTEAGRPYFVMELVRGQEIVKYAAEKPLPLEARLRLFVAVCNAVQHAHQKGIIHRDLKPSNILVTHFDGVPTPKVIDFGIAKAIGFRLTDKTMFTRFSAMVGTPQYMSPEQAEKNGADVDTRSDIYSLGILLYELLTGTTPLAPEKLRELNPLALVETVRDYQIETPSTRIARARLNLGSNEDEVRPMNIRGELDWVVMKSLSRDRTKRYMSAHEFGADIERYLAGNPVLAAAPSRFYKLKTLLRKHRTAATTACIVSLALISSAIACGVFAIKAHHANQRLTDSVGELQTAVTELEDAKIKIQSAADERLFDLANTIALYRFENSTQNEIFRIAKKHYPRFFSVPQEFIDEITINEDGVVTSEIVPQDLESGETDEDMYAIGPALYGYELDPLFQLPQNKLLEIPLNRIQTTIERNAEQRERIESAYEEDFRRNFPDEFEGTPVFFNSNHDSSQLSDRDRKMADEVAKLYQSSRTMFFQMLVTEYRRTFGNGAIQVADALNLLAASMIKDGQINPAKVTLQQSLMIAGNNDDVRYSYCEITAQKLLYEISKQ